MKTITIKIDAYLANEYCRKYRQIFETSEILCEDDIFLRGFVEDRLGEELDFLNNEMDDVNK